jgi:hypothetical protein
VVLGETLKIPAAPEVSAAPGSATPRTASPDSRRGGVRPGDVGLGQVVSRLASQLPGPARDALASARNVNLDSMRRGLQDIIQEGMGRLQRVVQDPQAHGSGPAHVNTPRTVAVPAETTKTTPGSAAARQSVLDGTSRHREALERRGIGTHYGDTSPYHAMSDAEKQSFLDSKVKPGAASVTPDQLTRGSCVEWAMEHVKSYYVSRGEKATWDRIEKTVRDDGLKGTTLARELARDGWKTIYVNPDTSYKGTTEPDPEHQYSHQVAREKGEYYGVPVSGLAVDFERDPSQLDKVTNNPFFVYVARGGAHVTAGVDGQVSELARGEGPTSHVIYQDPLGDISRAYAEQAYTTGTVDERRQRARHLWGSGLALIPPDR